MYNKIIVAKVEELVNPELLSALETKLLLSCPTQSFLPWNMLNPLFVTLEFPTTPELAL
jgi:hypothetical protein